MGDVISMSAWREKRLQETAQKEAIERIKKYLSEAYTLWGLLVETEEEDTSIAMLQRIEELVILATAISKRSGIELHINPDHTFIVGRQASVEEMGWERL